MGEIRDLETAEIAVQASLTGHIVFSTLHTNDAPSTITRLRDMGIPTFLITATVEGERPDANPADNTFTFTFEVKTAGSGGSGGGSVTVAAGAVKLTPAKPKAGSALVASASVTANGDPVRPSKVRCTGTLAGKKVAGKGSTSLGKATCRYSTPRSAKGKKLAGSMAITARGKTVTKRFAAKLG